ncbi:MAG TPA: hypothetical protein PKL84_11695 [Candidatus Hydrogenedentes bacterium]|nr:hypothetical protein [Candidatus Hydrogenedentota bacterium]
MTPEKRKKDFDCVQMKREIQERIYEATKGMTLQQRMAYTRKKIAESEFAHFLDLPGGKTATRL